MPLITRDSIDRVKDAVDIVEVVSDYTDLRQQGQRYVGLCPFHEERTGSFSVDTVNKVYYCFGCEAGGDVFRFLEQIESLEFSESVERLAERFGVELEYEDSDQGSQDALKRKQRLRELLQQATDFYVRYLWQSDEAGKARSYLAERDLGEEVLRKFQVGYAASKWDRILKLATSKGYHQEEIYSAGLLAKGKQDGFYDRFRARITFPLTDSRGRTLGFGARALRESQLPKYINSPEGPLYHKGSTLFGLNHARSAAIKADEILVVEGYTDVLALHQAGFENVVAVMGTAVTPKQVAELARLANTVTFALDADSAGQEAMLRALQTAQSRNLRLKVVSLPDDKDPCDLLQAGGLDEFKERLSEAKSLLEFQVETTLSKSDLTSAQGRDSAVSELAPIFALTAPSVARDEALRSVASRLDLSEELLLSLWSRSEKGAKRPQSVPLERPVSRGEAIERTYLAMCVAVGEGGREYLLKVDKNHFNSELLLRARDVLLEKLGEEVVSFDAGDRELVELISEIVVRSSKEPASIAKLEASFQTLELRRLDREITAAKQHGDFKKMGDLAQKRQLVKQVADSATGAAL